MEREGGGVWRGRGGDVEKGGRGGGGMWRGEEGVGVEEERRGEGEGVRGERRGWWGVGGGGWRREERNLDGREIGVREGRGRGHLKKRFVVLRCSLL